MACSFDVPVSEMAEEEDFEDEFDQFLF